MKNVIRLNTRECGVETVRVQHVRILQMKFIGDGIYVVTLRTGSAESIHFIPLFKKEFCQMTSYKPSNPRDQCFLDLHMTSLSLHSAYSIIHKSECFHTSRFIDVPAIKQDSALEIFGELYKV